MGVLPVCQSYVRKKGDFSGNVTTASGPSTSTAEQFAGSYGMGFFDDSSAGAWDAYGE